MDLMDELSKQTPGQVWNEWLGAADPRETELVEIEEYVRRGIHDTDLTPKEQDTIITKCSRYKAENEAYMRAGT